MARSFISSVFFFVMIIMASFTAQMAFGAPSDLSVAMEKAKHKILDVKIPPLCVTTKGNTVVDSSTILDGATGVVDNVIGKGPGAGGIS